MQNKTQLINFLVEESLSRMEKYGICLESVYHKMCMLNGSKAKRNNIWSLIGEPAIIEIKKSNGKEKSQFTLTIITERLIEIKIEATYYKGTEDEVIYVDTYKKGTLIAYGSIINRTPYEQSITKELIKVFFGE